MKLLLTLFILLTSSYSTWAQNPNSAKNLPFRIIFAENVYNKSGQKVKSLDLIPLDDILTIERGGYLSMVNSSWLPFEMEGDTTLVIKDLQNSFDLLRGNANGSYSPWGAHIDYLFIDDPDLANEKRLSMMGACSICDFDLEITYPPHLSQNIFVSRDLCIRWQSTGASRYKVKLSDLFDNPEIFETTTNELKIDSAIISELFNGEKLLFLQIADGKKSSSPVHIKKFPSSVRSLPYQCSAQRATYELLIALRLETGPREFPSWAAEHYKLAAELSDKKFFKTMLDNYNKRQGASQR